MNLLDLPNEILLMILNKLNNMDVLYSMLDVDNHQLDILAQGNTFTNALNFVLTTTNDAIVPLADRIVDRFCQNILPRIDQNIKCLILDSKSIEDILRSGNYSNLTELKLFNFNGKIVPRYFTGEYNLQTNQRKILIKILFA